MKRVLSILLSAAMILPLVAGVPVFGAGTALDDGKLVFSADFDNINPTPIVDDGNVSVVASDDGNAAEVVWDEVEYGGVNYSTDSFDLAGSSVMKFDILNNGAGNNVVLGVVDKDGDAAAIRFKSSSSAANYVPTGTWYTYVVTKDLTAYRKVKGTSTWETATVDNAVSKLSNEGSKTANSFRFQWGSSSSGAGSWLIDNVAVYESVPAVSVIVPEDVSKTHPVYLTNEGFEGSSTIFTKKADSAPALALVDPESDSDDTVLDIDLSTQTTFGSYWSSYYRAANIGFPDVSLRYNISLDFRRLNDAFDSEAIGIQVCPGPTTASRVTFKIPIGYFDKGEWYNISFETYGTAAGGSVLDATTLIATKLSDGTQTTLSTEKGNTWSGSQVGAFELYPTVTSDSMNSSALRATAHYQFDDIKISYETSDPIKTELLTTATSGNVQPLLVAYDENGVVTKIKEGEATALETVGTYGGAATAEYDVYAGVADWQNAKSVKVLYWDGYNTAKAYTDAVEIGDAISATVGTSTVVAKEIEISTDMIPADATGKYTVFAYSVPFSVDETNIPDYSATENTILALDQSEAAISKIVIDSSLYNGAEEDIVIVCNAEGASEAKVTLYEENDAPAFTNISMLLGADITERNFTWYSLDGGAGKLTYQKKNEMVDGAFSNSATVVEATRTHEDSVYSTKDYYYNNQAVMTGLEPDTEYVYQLSNGNSKSEVYTIKTADNDSTFSFAFGGDAQVGGNDDANYEQEHIYWGKSIGQMLNAEEFEGVEFFMSAGDQLESASTIKDIEAQYDIYLNHDEWATFPMAVTLGNHDAKPAGTHMQHFNEPNKLINPDTGTYYGASGGTGSEMDGVDYYYVYNSVLFMHINLNTFDDLSGDLDDTKKVPDADYEAAVAANRDDDILDAKEHGAFIQRVLEETADNKDILWKVVVCHQSPFGGSYHGNYTKASNGRYNRTEQYDYINEREYLLPYFYEAGVDLVLSGHDHTYTRTHIIKPNENDDILGDELNSMVITPYANTSGANYYTYADGTTTPTYTSWTDKSGNVWDGSATNRPYLKVSSKPVKVTDPDGFLWVTGSSSSGSQVNGAEYPNHYAAVCERISQRSLSRFDVTPTSIKLTTYNLGTNGVENDPLVVVDEFEIEKTAAVAVQGVSIDETAEIAVGQTKTLSAKLSPAEPTNKNVTWSSDNEAVAKVENGVVTAVSAGTANITVTTADGGHTATCAVTVVDAVPVTGITLVGTATMEVLTTKTLTATVAPETATTKTIKWSSSNEEIATVDANGNVTALKPGTVTITAAATDGSGTSASCEVTVNYVASTSVTLDKSSLAMRVMDKDSLSIKVEPANATYTDAVWTSSAPEIVSVDENGNLEAFATGTAVITATTGEGKSVSCTVTATGSVNLFEDFEDDALVMPGTLCWTRVQEDDGNWVYEFDGSKISSISMTAYALDTGVYGVEMAPTGYTVAFDYYKVSDEGYPAIEIRGFDHNGNFRGKRIGVSCFEKDTWYNVKLVYDPNGEYVWSGCYKKATDTEYTEFKQGVSDGDFGYDVTSSGTSNVYYDRTYITPYIKYSSADMNGVAADGSVDKTTATRVANAQKTAFKIDNIKISTPVSATGIELAESSATMEIGDTTAIAPVFAPSNATDTNVTYSTSNESVATVNRFGKVTAVGAGTANITVTAADGGYAKTFAVTVKSNEPEITVTKTESGTDWKFEVSANIEISGGKVYVAAYDANDLLISAAIADYGTELTMAQDADASYFRAFIWDENQRPLINSKKFN